MIGPAALLTLVFATVVVLALMAERLAPSIIVSGLALSVVAYAAIIGLLARASFARMNRLRGLSRTDSLTGLPNRRALLSDLHASLATGDEGALAIVGLDGFKLVNDHYSHSEGDRLLQLCACIIREGCGDEAQCYRMGGDEFAIARTGPMSANIVEGICRSLLERLANPLQIGDRRVTIGASIGLSRRDRSGPRNTQELLRQADMALYASKRGGRMRCTWFTAALDSSRQAKRVLDLDMRRALAQREFELHYQPLVAADDERIIAVEALLRWPRPGCEPIGPQQFIPIAEESGLIHAIGLFVLRQACLDALPWEGIKLSINISAAQLRNPEFPIHLGQILEETGFPPDRLELEITETSLVLDPVVAERSLAVIRGFGVDIALDDFGTGYASIGFLRRFRFEKLKIDRSLVAEAGNDEGSRAMMLSSITVAQALKMNVTAEGVETEEQAEMVRAAGCDQIQGWLYHKAMPAAEVASSLSMPHRRNRSLATTSTRNHP